jgi:hypothetical protein
MSVLEILPPELFRLILEFLEHPKGLIPLDNAILSHRLRPFYLNAIERMTLSLHIGTARNYLTSVWLLNRKILPTSIWIFPFDHPSYLLLIERSRLVLKSLSISYSANANVDAMLLFLGNFPHLIQLDINSINFNATSNFVRFLCANPQLEKLTVPFLNTPSREFIRDISQCCPNLKELYASKNNWFDDACVTLLIQGRLQKLEHLELGSTAVLEEASIVNILTHFPLLKSFTIRNCNFSMNTKFYFMNEYALPRWRSVDPELQLIGISGFSQVLKVRLSLSLVSCLDFC